MEIPGYRGLQEIHRGHRHVVFRGVRAADEQPVVIKTALPGTGNARLLAEEHRTLKALDLPRVARPLAFEMVDGLPALVMADAGPAPLSEWIRRRPLDLGRFLPVAIQIAETLAALHARGVIHRDVNPSNIVLDANGQESTLVDFDAATRSTGKDAPPEAPETLTGTLAYMAPEQTGRLDRGVDHRADLYALGVTFYEVLTGRLPFYSPDPGETVHAHLAQPASPPSTANPKIPQVLSDLVLKLLCKMPEERYQRTEALVHDLEEALARWRSTGTIDPFDLGQADLMGALPHRERLRGREQELAFLVKELDRAAAGANHVLLVTGPAGVGKSALVHELGRLAAERGRFITGKFEQLRGDAPYMALAAAMRSLCRSWMDGPAEARQRWRAQLQDALGRNARVMIDFIPELQELLGKAAPVPPLGPVEAASRFHLSLSAFMRVVAAQQGPLILFLDDLQWADVSSLNLLALLATDPDVRRFLLVGTVREGGAGAGTPLAQTLAVIRSRGGTIHEVTLAPLAKQAVVELCADVLESEPALVEALAGLVYEKTGGNPFFVRRFLLFLHRTGLLRPERGRAGWTWDADAIGRADVTDNVLGLMLATIQRLPEEVQRMLKAASCFGGAVELRLLPALVGQPAARVDGHVQRAAREGLLVIETEAGDDGQPRPRVCRFVHDRVQQAAYSLLPDPERARHHLAIGRGLLTTTTHDDAGLFEVVDQLARASTLITEAADRLQLADLSCRASAQARLSLAYEPALGYLKTAIAAFPVEASRSRRELYFRLHRDAMQLAHLVGEHDLADSLARTAFDSAQTPSDQAEIYNIRIVACSLRGSYREAIDEGRKALSLLGLELPAAGQRSAELESRLGSARRDPQALLELPLMTDERQLARSQLLANLLDPAYVCDHGLLGVLVEHLVDLSLRHGNSVFSAFAYAVYGMLIGLVDGDRATGHALGRAGVELSRRFADPVQECRTLHIFGAFVNHWQQPASSSLSRLRAAVDRGLEGGDLHYAAYADYSAVAVALHMGLELSRIASEIERSFARVRKTKVQANVPYLLACRQAVRCLQGRTRGPGQFGDEDFQESDHLAAWEANPIALWLYRVLRLQACYLLGEHEAARALAAAAIGQRGAVGGAISVVDHTFYSALLLTARQPALVADDGRARLHEHAQELARWAEQCPDNFLHKRALVDAEIARLERRDADAADLYDQAIDAAHRQGFLADEALGNELAGRHHRARGHRRIGDFYLRAAMEGFARWGAIAKVASMEGEFPHLAELPWRVPLPSMNADGRVLDLHSLLKAAGSISSEVAMDRLLDRLLTVCFEVAGAARGALVLEEESTLVVRAVGAVGAPVSIERTPLALSSAVPRALVEEAHRASEALTVGDGHSPPSTASDPYLRQHAVKSALVLPIQHHGRAVGVLYLENNLTAYTFTPARRKVLDLLSSQIAISLENSSLFEKLTREIEDRKRAEAQAQALVRVRDEFLSIASHELNTPVTSLQLALQTLASDPDNLPPGRIAEMAKLAERQGRRLAVLVGDLLDISRLRSRRLQLVLRQTDLREVVRDVLNAFSLELSRAGCPVVVNDPAPVVGLWDQTRLEQVVTNLVGNALKFARGHAIEVDVALREDRGILRVTDHGIGIPPERLGRIFERFERAVSSDHYGGLGLGLYIARELVTAMGGSISAESTLGVGATFIVELPCAGPSAHAGDIPNQPELSS